MSEHTILIDIQIDRVDALIRWHLPQSPVRPSSRLRDSGDATGPARLPGRASRAPREWPPAEQRSIFPRPMELVEQA
jgi:hypothetical protein